MNTGQETFSERGVGGDSVSAAGLANKHARGVRRTVMLVILVMTTLVSACTGLPTVQERLPRNEAPAQVIVTMPPPHIGQAPDAVQIVPVHEGGQWAFIREQVLYIHLDGQEIPVEDCRNGRCDVYFPTWSPNGQYLLYYVGIHSETPENNIRVAGLDGISRTLTDQAAFIRPASWSPDGDAVVYFRGTGTFRDDSPLLGLEEIFEVWVAKIESEGGFLDADPPGELLGEVGFGHGCGGGGRSESAYTYEREGGYAYGYLAGVMEWADGNILLYSKNCTSRGIGRFDLRRGEDMEPYAQDVAGLVLNPARDQWVAVDQNGRLTLGTPEQLETQTLNNVQRAELVYWGSFSGNFYYTTWETVYDGDLSDVLGRMNDSIWVSPYFDSGQASIRRFAPATGADELIWSAQDYAYARIREDAQGALIFAAVESGERLYSALRAQQVTNENLREYLPTVRIQMLQAGAEQPVQISAPAERFTLWQ